MVKGVLSKKQRHRKKMREIVHFAFANKNRDWKNFVNKANTGNNDIVDTQRDRDESAKILEDWRRQQNNPTNV